MRISYEVLDKLKNLTNKEMDLFIYIARHQNLAGTVYGLHHKDVCEACEMSKQSFYNSLYALQEKNVITYTKKTDIDYDITITNNSFDGPGGFAQAKYINLHRKFVTSAKFKKLKANEKYLLFSFIKVSFKRGRTYGIGLQTFYNNFTQSLKIAIRTLRYYLASLKEFFQVIRKNGNYEIISKDTLFEEESRTSDDIEYMNFINSMCRRHKVTPIGSALKEAATLIKQYRGICKNIGADIYKTLEECIKQSSIIHGELEYRYIHQLVRVKIGM